MQKTPYVFVTLASLFCLSMFYRSSNAVMALDLINDLQLNAETIGILGGAFFYSFSLLQIPMGPMLDRIGPRKIISLFALIGALGSFAFALSPTFSMAIVGRILIGIGMAAMFMGSLKVLVLRFAIEKFATLTGLIVTAGAFGSLLSASPLAFLNALIGWRATFILTGFITFALGILLFFLLGDDKTKDNTINIDTCKITTPEKKHSVKIILTSHTFWQIGVIAFFRYGTFISLQGLWLGVYLMAVQGYTPLQAGNILILVAIGNAIGAPVSGRLSDKFHSRKKMVLFGLGSYTLLLLFLTGAVELRHPALYATIYFFIGFFNGFGTLLYSHIKDLFPVSISATTMAWINFFTMAGGAVIMPLMGRIIESFYSAGSYPVQAYRLTFFLCFLGMAGSLIYYLFSKSRDGKL